TSSSPAHGAAACRSTFASSSLTVTGRRDASPQPLGAGGSSWYISTQLTPGSGARAPNRSLLGIGAPPVGATAILAPRRSGAAASAPAVDTQQGQRREHGDGGGDLGADMHGAPGEAVRVAAAGAAELPVRGDQVGAEAPAEGEVDEHLEVGECGDQRGLDDRRAGAPRGREHRDTA